MASGLDTVIENVSALLAAPAEGRGAPSRARIEATLTEGYATALALDGERLRLGRRLDRMTIDLAHGRASSQDLQRLIRRLAETETDLADLRELLSSLRGRAARAA